MNLLLCLQFCPVDAKEAVHLAKLIADNEPEKRYDVEFALSYRPDTPIHFVEEAFKALSEKFQFLFVNKSSRTGQGWPHGCNDLWFDTMNWVFMLKRDRKIKSTGILTFEADNAPLKRDWINILQREWSENSAGKYAVGNIYRKPTPHVNGNGMFLIDLPGILGSKMHGCPGTIGWDMHLASTLTPKAYDTNELFQIYDGKVETLEELAKVKKNGVRPALLHGLKGINHINLAREFLALTPDQLERLEVAEEEVKEGLEKAIESVDQEAEAPKEEPEKTATRKTRGRKSAVKADPEHEPEEEEAEESASVERSEDTQASEDQEI